jgi:glycosyltransferase involved in cell wall biosynthesis
MFDFLPEYPGIVVLHDELNTSLPKQNLLKKIKGSSIIVHNRYSYEKILKENEVFEESLHVVNELMPINEEILSTPKDTVKDALGIPKKSFIIGSFGLATKVKHICTALLAFEKSFQGEKNIFYLHAGHNIQDNAVKEFLEKKKKTEDGFQYIVKTDLPFGEFSRYIYISDLCVNLRNPYFGETSASMLRAMSLGVPCIVTDVGAFSEVSDDSVIKVSPQITVDELSEIYKYLKNSQEKLDRIRENAFLNIREKHNPEYVCEQYKRIIDKRYQNNIDVNTIQ